MMELKRIAVICIMLLGVIMLNACKKESGDKCPMKDSDSVIDEVTVSDSLNTNSDDLFEDKEELVEEMSDIIDWEEENDNNDEDSEKDTLESQKCIEPIKNKEKNTLEEWDFQ